MKTVKLTLPGMDDYFTQEAFNVLRTNIQFCGSDVKVITLTSCGMNEGKTVLSLHIGRSLAELNKRVLIIDADMRKSVMLGRNAELEGEKDATEVSGLSEVLTNQATLQEAICATQFENFYVLFSGKFPPNPVELLNSDQFGENIDALAKLYDYIIIDTPPLGMVIDAAVVAARCDSAIMVIDSNRVRYSIAQDVVDQLEKSGCKVLGVVLNHAFAKRKGYYYYRSRYGYYYGGKRYGYKYSKYSQYGQYTKYASDPDNPNSPQHTDAVAAAAQQGKSVPQKPKKSKK